MGWFKCCRLTGSENSGWLSLTIHFFEGSGVFDQVGIVEEFQGLAGIFAIAGAVSIGDGA